tara:strand:- start:454 stop:672 length:219 start_codon:yes stop_codon:yes gene_type:complete
MKFILIVQLCSIALNTCQTPVKMGISFNTHYDCAIGGYSILSSMTKELGIEKVNKEKLIINFRCIEEEEIDA